jgi:hypothetical protein
MASNPLQPPAKIIDNKPQNWHLVRLRSARQGNSAVGPGQEAT